MIGLGIDLVCVSSFRQQLDDQSSSFRALCFTEQERRTSQSRSSGNPVIHLAARYAAKEALIKAWSSMRFGRPELLPDPNYREIEVVNDHVGRPRIKLHGQLSTHLSNHRIQLSLSHDGDYSTAVVMLIPGDQS